jgi:AAA15 family ATPase/GTPase
MIDNIDVQNFRCFKHISLRDCRRINLIVGRNASGKTALLEAIFLASGASPELGWRGSGKVIVTADPSAYENIWKDLFHNFVQDKAIRIQFQGSAGFGRSLSIFYQSTPEVHLPLGQDISAIQTVTPIIFIYTDENKKDYKVTPIITEGTLNLGAAKMPPMRSAFFPTHSPVPVQQYAGFFSALSKQKRESAVIELLRTEFPFVKNISAEIGAGNLWALYATLDELPEKIPVTLLSSGVTKLLFILLSIAMQPKGILLIDEIENGFYFDRLPSIWALILKFASQYDVQIFATTHSLECLQAAANVADKKPDDFRVIQTNKANGLVEIQQFGGEHFVHAIEENVEIR